MRRNITIRRPAARSGLLGIVTGAIIALGACMDVSPPAGKKASGEELLHSVILPFNKAILGVGDTLTIVPRGRLINGDTIDLDLSTVKYSLFPLSGAVTVDSTGLLKVSAVASSYVTLTVNYTLGDKTGTATSHIYTRQDRYDVSHIEIFSLDSAKGGQILSGDRPSYGIRVHTTDGDTLPGLEYRNMLSFFYTDSTTSNRSADPGFSIQPDLKGHPNIFSILQLGGNFYGKPIWIGVEGLVFNKYVRDSAVFTSLYPAEGLVQPEEVENGTVLEYTHNVYVTSCGLFTLYNFKPYQLEVEFSKPTNELSCGGATVESGPLVAAPFSIASRKLALPVGDSLSWKITRVEPDIFNGKPARINSTIHIIPSQPEEK